MKSLLDNGLAALGIEASDQQRERWLAYVALLAKWNKAYNLTAVRDPREMISRHILDSLSIAPHILGQRLLDVGAGAGIPSIPLAILWPTRQITALDSNGKKTRFMEQVKNELRLDNFNVIQSRVEDFKTDLLYDGILSRAYASLGDFVDSSQHLLAPGGTFWAMKAVIDSNELSEVLKPYKVSTCLPLHVPGCVAERHLIAIQRDGATTANTP
jgi:16S rRNA (guanine527-N7)-methyltransferase